MHQRVGAGEGGGEEFQRLITESIASEVEVGELTVTAQENVGQDFSAVITAVG